MMVPLYARYIAAAVGLFLVVIDCISLVGTLIVPRPAGGRLMIWVDRLVHTGFQLLTAPVRNYRRRDRILAAEAATLLICQLLAWLAGGVRRVHPAAVAVHARRGDTVLR